MQSKVNKKKTGTSLRISTCAWFLVTGTSVTFSLSSLSFRFLFSRNHTQTNTQTLFSVRILIFLGCIAIVPCVCWMCVCHFMYPFSIGRFEVSLHTSFNSSNDVSFLCWFFTCSHFGFSFLFFCCTINCDVRIRLIMHSFYMWLCSMTTYCDAVRSDSTDTLCTDDHFRTPQCNL